MSRNIATLYLCTILTVFVFWSALNRSRDGNGGYWAMIGVFTVSEKDKNIQVRVNNANQLRQKRRRSQKWKFIFNSPFKCFQRYQGLRIRLNTFLCSWWSCGLKRWKRISKYWYATILTVPFFEPKHWPELQADCVRNRIFLLLLSFHITLGQKRFRSFGILSAPHQLEQQRNSLCWLVHNSFLPVHTRKIFL